MENTLRIEVTEADFPGDDNWIWGVGVCAFEFKLRDGGGYDTTVIFSDGRAPMPAYMVPADVLVKFYRWVWDRVAA
jgi:hypothetical protein